jgi:hypothetical protein
MYNLKNYLFSHKYNLIKKMKKMKFSTITLIKTLIRIIYLHAIMFGFIMFVLFGSHNVIFNKKMGLSTSKVYKILKREDINMNVQFARGPNQVLVSSVMIPNVENITIQNAQEKRRYIWNSLIFKK